MPGTSPAPPLSDEDFEQAFERELKRKQTTGSWALARLQEVRNILAPMPLNSILTHPCECERRLRSHYINGLARHQHMRTVVGAIKALRKRAPDAALQAWTMALARAKEDSDAECREIENLLRADPMQATKKSMEVYATDLHTALAKMNAPSLLAVLTNPGEYRERLRQACAHEGSEKNHTEKLVSVFNRNPALREAHPEACEAWVAAGSEHTVRFALAAKQNAASLAQTENFVSKSEYTRKLAELLSATPDPHAKLQDSQALLLLAYLCGMPPKRSEMGTVAIFATQPTADQLAAAPNHIVLDHATLRLGKHKTARHYGALVENLETEFMSVLRASLARWPRQHLWVRADGSQHTNNTWSKWVMGTMTQLFQGRAAGPSLLRHAEATALYCDGQACGMTDAELEAHAARMGHSVSMSRRYRFPSLRARQE